jgi:hypothetical protein
MSIREFSALPEDSESIYILDSAICQIQEIFILHNSIIAKENTVSKLEWYKIIILIILSYDDINSNIMKGFVILFDPGTLQGHSHLLIWVTDQSMFPDTAVLKYQFWINTAGFGNVPPCGIIFPTYWEIFTKC